MFNLLSLGLDPTYLTLMSFTSLPMQKPAGDRLPGVFLHRDNRVIVAMNVDRSGTTYYTSGQMKKDTWYTFEIRQQEVHLGKPSIKKNCPEGDICPYRREGGKKNSN